MKIKRLLILVFFILTAIIMIPNVSKAAVDDSFTTEGITYKVLTESANNYTVEVSKYEGDLTSVTIPKTVKNEENIYTITSIGENAFVRCTSLTSVTIPPSVTSIDDSAVYDCNNLTIYGGNNTAAQEYADAKNIPFVNIYHSVKYSLINLTSTGKDGVESGLDYTTTLTCDEGYKLPKNIIVKINGINLSINDYAYDSKTGNLKIEADKINGNIEIEAIGNKIYKVSFDANDGEFSDGTNIINFVDADDCDFDNLTIPTRDGYKFIGYYTEKTGGTSIENVMNSEAGVDKDVVFYAQWEEKPVTVQPNPEEDNQANNSNNNTDTTNTTNEASNDNISSVENPQTSDNIITFVVILAIAVIGIVITTTVKKNIKE